MCFKIVYLFATLIVAYCVGHSLQIIDGNLAEISDYPYAASIQSNGTHICGGSIISSKYILTAASCFDNYIAENLTVRVGSSFYKYDGQLANVSAIHKHPSYNQTEAPLLNNLAVLELMPSLVLGKDVAVIATAITSNVTLDDPGIIVGWGIVIKEESGWVKPYKPSEQLRYSTQPVVGPWTCDNTFIEGWDEDTMFCAGISHKDNCVGDTGNPFVVNNTQIGIASETLLMCGEFPTAYMNVTWYTDFISKFI